MAIDLLSVEELRRRSEELREQEHLVEGILQARSIAIIAGESTIGKTPWAYQLAICVATGTPFLGFTTRTSKVAYVDLENGVIPLVDLLTRQSEFLGADSELVQDNLRIFSTYAASSSMGIGRLSEVAREVEDGLLIVDTLSALDGRAEEKNVWAREVMSAAQGLIREHNVTVAVLHHLRKASRQDPRPPLASTPAQEWFNDVRGAGLLTNAPDVRIALSAEAVKGFDEDCVVFRGVTRLTGEFGPYVLTRVKNDNGLPMGYRRLGSAVLKAQYRVVFEKLPGSFRHKTAQTAMGNNSSSDLQTFLDTCTEHGLIKKLDGNKGYVKLVD